MVNRETRLDAPYRTTDILFVCHCVCVVGGRLIRTGGGGMGGQQMQQIEKAKQQEEQKAAAEEQRAQILKAILSPEARERMCNIKMVKEAKGRQIEDMLINRAQRGQLGGVVDEDTLIQMLESINEQQQEKSKVSFTRRRMDDDWD